MPRGEKQRPTSESARSTFGIREDLCDKVLFGDYFDSIVDGAWLEDLESVLELLEVFEEERLCDFEGTDDDVFAVEIHYFN